jgi:hypothetical protein
VKKVKIHFLVFIYKVKIITQMDKDIKHIKDINYILLINWFLTSSCLSSSNFKSISLIRNYLRHEMNIVLNNHYIEEDIKELQETEAEVKPKLS